MLPSVSGTRNVFAERTSSGFFLDIEWNRDALARYGLSIETAQSVVQHAIGGENVTTTVEGRERYPVNVRYMRDFRSDPDAIARVLVPASDGQRQIPLGELARVKVATGPAMIRNEDGLITGYVFVDVAGRDISGYVDEASRVVREQVKVPPGYAVLWSGQYEAMARVRARLAYIIPFTLLLVFVLLYLSTGSLVKTAIVSLAVPFSAVGAIWYLYLLGYNMSIAVWVGLIALLGVDAQTGVFMLLYLDLAYEKARRDGRLRTLADLQATIVEGAAKRLRPKFMTMATTFIGLIPIMWATGTGSDVWKRIAAPMVGGILTSFVLELVVYPAIYEIWKWHFEMKRAARPKRGPPMSRLLILGATGSLGRHVLGQAVAAGHDVTVFVRTPSKLPPEVSGRVSVHTGDLGTSVPRDLIEGQDALINCAGHVAGGETFVALIDRLVTAVDSLPVPEQPVCWFLAGAALLDLDPSGRRGVDLPKVKSTYWPHRVNFERLGRSRLDWRLLCPGPMVDEPALGLDRLRDLDRRGSGSGSRIRSRAARLRWCCHSSGR